MFKHVCNDGFFCTVMSDCCVYWYTVWSYTDRASRAMMSCCGDELLCSLAYSMLLHRLSIQSQHNFPTHTTLGNSHYPSHATQLAKRFRSEFANNVLLLTSNQNALTKHDLPTLPSLPYLHRGATLIPRTMFHCWPHIKTLSHNTTCQPNPTPPSLPDSHRGATLTPWLISCCWPQIKTLTQHDLPTPPSLPNSHRGATLTPWSISYCWPHINKLSHDLTSQPYPTLPSLPNSRRDLTLTPRSTFCCWPHFKMLSHNTTSQPYPTLPSLPNSRRDLTLTPRSTSYCWPHRSEAWAWTWRVQIRWSSWSTTGTLWRTCSCVYVGVFISPSMVCYNQIGCNRFCNIFKHSPILKWAGIYLVGQQVGPCISRLWHICLRLCRVPGLKFG